MSKRDKMNSIVAMARALIRDSMLEDALARWMAQIMEVAHNHKAAEISALKVRVAELEAENALLASWQCIHTDGKTGIVCDEYGNQYCAKDKI
jgi:hypothetical protein